MAKYIDLIGLDRFLDRLKTLVIAFKLKNDGAAEMDGCSATGTRSVAEGQNTTASANYSHAEGGSTKASGGASHAEGFGTTARGYHSHAEGDNTTASGDTSHAEGYHTTARNEFEHAEGRYNVSNSTTTEYGSSGNTQHSVGIGPSPYDRKNAFEIMQNGDAYLYGVGGYTGTTINSQWTLQSVIGNLTTQITNLTNQVTGLTAQINAIKEVTDHLVYDPVNKCINFVFDEE